MTNNSPSPSPSTTLSVLSPGTRPVIATMAVECLMQADGKLSLAAEKLNRRLGLPVIADPDSPNTPCFTASSIQELISSEPSARDLFHTQMRMSVTLRAWKALSDFLDALPAQLNAFAAEDYIKAIKEFGSIIERFTAPPPILPQSQTAAIVNINTVAAVLSPEQRTALLALQQHAEAAEEQVSISHTHGHAPRDNRLLPLPSPRSTPRIGTRPNDNDDD